MDNPTIIGHEGNPVCGDDITVYLRLEYDVILDYSFSGDISMHAIAASSFWYEFLIGATVEEVLGWTDAVIQQEWFVLSERRKRAGALALVAVRNALHERLGDRLIDSFDDVLT